MQSDVIKKNICEMWVRSVCQRLIFVKACSSDNVDKYSRLDHHYTHGDWLIEGKEQDVVFGRGW